MNTNEVILLRRRLGWTQERMARELGLSWSTINRWENGKAVPRGLSKVALERLNRILDGHADQSDDQEPVAAAAS